MELQTAKKQQNETIQKYEQANKDAEFYHTEAESWRSRYNEVIVEKQRLEQDVNSLRHFMEEERKEMAELRRQQQLPQAYGDSFCNWESLETSRKKEKLSLDECFSP